MAPAAGLPPGPLQGKISPWPGSAQGPVTVFVELAQIPAVGVFHAERGAGQPVSVAAAARAASSRIGQAADRVLGLLRRRSTGVHELFRTSNAVPGLVVIADAAAVGELAGSPGIHSVRKIVPKTLVNSNTVQLTRTLRAWQRTGWLGDGVRIGIIDDGIDYTHADFGGPGTRAAYTAIDRTVVTPSYFPTHKVVGGYDFAGDDYNGTAGTGAIPRLDPNPLACGEHGNHVAGTAAGFGVNGAGSTFRGNYQHLDPAELNALRIGPGTAPHAQLYALKIFGCHGSTALVAKALDPNGDGDFSDRLDVVNLSLGADYGAPDDPDSLFVRKLASNGVWPAQPGLRRLRQPGSRRPGGAVVRSGQRRRLPALLEHRGGGKYVWLEWDDDNATRRCGSKVRVDNASAAGAAAVNTAGVDIYSREGQQGPIEGPNRVGAGRVDAAAAVANQVLAMVEDDPGQVSAVNVGSVIDSTVPALFDAVRPALWAEGTGDPALNYLARPGTALVVNRDTGAAVVQRATQLLVLHLDDPAGHRVQVVRVSAGRRRVGAWTGERTCRASSSAGRATTAGAVHRWCPWPGPSGSP